MSSYNQKKALNILFSDDVWEFDEYENNIKKNLHTISDVGPLYKISIIMPVYNMENYINRSLNSIINQSFNFSDLEVILVDDCSTDNTQNIIKEYMEKYKNIKCIFLNENSGFAGKPRNIGVNHASCDYIMFLDPDDMYLPNACEILYDIITNDDVDLVSGNYIDAKFNENNPYNWKSRFNLSGYKIKANSVTDNTNLLNVHPSIWAKIYRRDLITSNQIFFPENLPGEDLYFNFLSLFLAKGIIFIDEPIVKYMTRDDEDNMSFSLRYDSNMLVGLLKLY